MKADKNQDHEAEIKPLKDLCVKKVLLDVHWWHLSSALTDETFHHDTNRENENGNPVTKNHEKLKKNFIL